MVFPHTRRLSEFMKRRRELSSAFSSTIEWRKIFPRALFSSFHVNRKKAASSCVLSPPSQPSIYAALSMKNKFISQLLAGAEFVNNFFM